MNKRLIKKELGQKLKICQNYSFKYTKTLNEIYEILEKNNINTSDERFIDTIGAQLHYGGYGSTDAFVNDLQNYIDGNYFELKQG